MKDGVVEQPEGLYPRYLENPPGPFYVESDLCVNCRIPELEAPDLIGFGCHGSGSEHCYFKKQPETPDELDRAISAMSMACCGAYRYGGDDPRIVRRLLAAGVEVGQIDTLTPPG